VGSVAHDFNPPKAEAGDLFHRLEKREAIEQLFGKKQDPH
jgi:hypothetical protein